MRGGILGGFPCCFDRRVHSFLSKCKGSVKSDPTQRRVLKLKSSEQTHEMNYERSRVGLVIFRSAPMLGDRCRLSAAIAE